jgi:hypothetical protein
MDRLNLPAGILKELAKQRLKGISETMPGLNVGECLEYLNKPMVREHIRRSTKEFKNSKYHAPRKRNAVRSKRKERP